MESTPTSTMNSNGFSYNELSASKVSRPREEFFDKLSKTQIKAQNTGELSLLKVEQELRECTFKPQINQASVVRERSRDVSREPAERGTSECSFNNKNHDEVWKRLHVENMESKNWEKIEKEKVMLELRECTFSPHIN